MAGSRIGAFEDFVPPILWRGLKRLRRKYSRLGATKDGQQQGAAYYDAQFAAEPMLQVHYTKARKYPLYTVVGDRLRACRAECILDIGCGPGQMASLLRDQGVAHYLGVDISRSRIEAAQRICPEFTFVVADIFATDLIEVHRYDTLLATEFLEHVEDDVCLVQRIPLGVRVLASVPNFPHESHVRYFDSVTSVQQRYGNHLRQMEVATLQISPDGRKFFIVQGVK